MVVTAWTMIGAGVAITAIVAPLLARWIARRSATARGWAAAAAVAIVAAVAPWGLVCALPREKPPIGAPRREVVRVEAPSRAMLDALAGPPQIAACERVGVGSHESYGGSPHQGSSYSSRRLRCGFATFTHGRNSSHSDIESSGSSGWYRREWSCMSRSRTASDAVGSYSVENQLRVRFSRDGRLAEFTCAIVRCEAYGGRACEDPDVTGSWQSPLYLAERDIPTPDPPQPRVSRPHGAAFGATLVTAAMLVLRLMVRSAVPSPATDLPAAYRNAPPTAPSPELAQRRLLLATTFLFGAVAAASWFALLRALG